MKIQDLMSQVAAQISEMLVAKRTLSWSCPWTGGNFNSMPLRHTGEPYRGANVLILWARALSQGYTSPFWMTFKQAQALGACVKKGEKAAHVVYYGRFEKEVKNAAGDAEKQKFAVMRSYAVFNADQIEGLPEKYHPTAPAPVADTFEAHAGAEAFVKNTGANVIQTLSSRAYYSLTLDQIHTPLPTQFASPAAYYGTILHELVHWTGAEARCNRPLGGRHGEDAYATEELVAEIGAAFLCVALGVTPAVREDHAAYVGSWLKRLKDDPREIFRAAAAAQKAVDFLQGLQPGAVAAEEEEAEAEALLVEA